MLIVNVAGGLGNQMQQYALYKKLVLLGRDARLDMGWFSSGENGGGSADDAAKPVRTPEIDLFTGTGYRECTKEEREAFIGSDLLSRIKRKLLPAGNGIFRESGMYHPEVLDFTHKYIYGYFHCLEYSADIADELKEDFSFPAHPDPAQDERNKELMNRMESENSVSVHLRRGDYVNDPANAALFGGIATDDYYEGAMRYMRERMDNIRFYIFTNDPEYALARYGDTSVYTVVRGNTGRQAMLDMELMSHCRGNICANSTFSIWGGRLNVRDDAIRLRTSRMKNTQSEDARTMQGYWKDWILMDERGEVVP